MPFVSICIWHHSLYKWNIRQRKKWNKWEVPCQSYIEIIALPDNVAVLSFDTVRKQVIIHNSKKFFNYIFIA